MKKSLLFVIAIVLLLTLVACGCQHDWLDATCVTPQSCSLCGEVQGEVLGHIAGDWKLYSTDMVDATVTSKKYCNVCGTEVDEQTVQLQQLYFGDIFMPTPVEFVKRIDKMLDRIGLKDYTVNSGSARGEFACGIYESDTQVGFLLFGTGEGSVTVDQKNDSCISTILGSADDPESYANIMTAIVLACDPLLTVDDAFETAITVTDRGEYSQNGITYSVEFPSKGAVFSVSISE